MTQPVPIRPRGLLLHARALADHRSPRGRPLLIWLRRSTSTAYYAVFHRVALAVAEQVGSGLPQEDRVRFARSVDHTKIAEVCRWIVARQPAGKEHVRDIVGELQADANLRELAAIFLELQQARHDADYDHLTVVRKVSVDGWVDQAERALDLLDGLAGTDNGRRFLVLIGLHTQLR